MKTTTVLQPNGRIVIPTDIRQQIGITAGERLEITIEQGRLVLTPQIQILRQAQALFSAQPAQAEETGSAEHGIDGEGEGSR